MTSTSSEISSRCGPESAHSAPPLLSPPLLPPPLPPLLLQERNAAAAAAPLPLGAPLLPLLLLPLLLAEAYHCARAGLDAAPVFGMGRPPIIHTNTVTTPN